MLQALDQTICTLQQVTTIEKDVIVEPTSLCRIGFIDENHVFTHACDWMRVKLQVCVKCATF